MKLTPQQIENRKQQLAEAINMHEVEGNALSNDQIAMFEMFEREGWAHEKRRAYILARYKNRSEQN